MQSNSTMKTYPKYKDSNIPWIGRIPQDWNLTKIGQVYDERNEKVSDKDYQPLSVTKNGVVPQLENAAKTDNGDNRKLVRVNDFVINSRSDRRGSCGISEYEGSVSLINTVLTPRNSMCNRYYNYTFKSECFSDEFYKWGNGIVDDLWSTKWSAMKKIYIPLPPIEVQQSIAAYLDRKCSAIDRVIEAESRIIEKLREYRQSLITETVTGRITPFPSPLVGEGNARKGEGNNAPSPLVGEGEAIGVEGNMKASGIPWIGRIPRHWTVEKLKKLFSFGKGLNITKENLTETGIPVISYGQIHSKKNTGTHITDDLIKFVPEVYLENNPQSLVNKGDFIFADTSEDIEGAGSCVFIDKSMQLFAGYHSVILRNIDSDFMLGRYLSYLFCTGQWRSQIRSRVYGIKVYSITQKILKELTVIIPPLSEQKSIAAYLDRKCSAIDSTISKKQQIIEKMTEYKKSLIYECVTGKLSI